MVDLNPQSPWPRSHRQLDQTVNETIDCPFPGTSDAPKLFWLMDQKHSGASNKGPPPRFLGFSGAHTNHTYVNRESDPSLGDWNFHLSSRWHSDLNLRSQALNLNPYEFEMVICFGGNVLSQRITTCGLGSNGQAVDQMRLDKTWPG